MGTMVVRRDVGNCSRGLTETAVVDVVSGRIGRRQAIYHGEIRGCAMKMLVHYLIVIAVLSLQVACTTKEGSTTQQITRGQKVVPSAQEVESSREKRAMLSWDSPKVLQLKHDWEAMRDSFPRPLTRSNSGERNKMLSDLLRKKLSRDEMRELAATCGTLPVAGKDWNPFELDVISKMVFVFLESGDRDSLVTLLSTRFPQTVAFKFETEECLVRLGEKLKDPVLVLGEAYSRCQVPEVRGEIATAVRRGFAGLGISGKRDDEFVENAMRWYKQHKDEVTFDAEYCFDRDLAPPSYRHPLFKKKG